MAHELMFNDDGEAMMAYVDDIPWHGLGTPLQNPPTATEAIQAAHLDWSVDKAPVFYHTSISNTGIVPNLFALTPGDGWSNKERPLFGVVSRRYEILQNRDAFSFFDPIVQSGYATYETAGALGRGERIWVLAKLKNDFEVADRDMIQRYLLLSNTHDGHATVQVRFTPIRVVCQNTLSIAMEDNNQTTAVRHNQSLFPNLGMAADDMMDRIESRYGAIQKMFLRMREKKMEKEALEEYLAVIFPVPPKPEDDRNMNRWNRARQTAQWSRKASAHLYRTSPSCRMAGTTGWAAYNAVTEFVDHCRPANSRGRSPAAQLDRIWFGTGYQIKVRAYELAMEMCRN